jgi:hypothetical protein
VACWVLSQAVVLFQDEIDHHADDSEQDKSSGGTVERVTSADESANQQDDRQGTRHAGPSAAE